MVIKNLLTFADVKHLKTNIMAIIIKPNNYKEITETRENIVQYICDAFLKNGAWSGFHPKSAAQTCRRRSTYVLVRNERAYGFHYQTFSSIGEKDFEVRKCEVELAIELLLKAGYYLYRHYQYGCWITYSISKYPRLTDKTRVNKIDDNDWDGDFQ